MGTSNNKSKAIETKSNEQKQDEIDQRWEEIKSKQINEIEQYELSVEIDQSMSTIDKAVKFLESKGIIVENGLLGIGGCGFVLKACDVQNDYLAIKIMVNSDKSQKRAFIKEFKILKQFESQHVIKVMEIVSEVHESSNYQIMIMERCKYDLKSYLKTIHKSKKQLSHVQLYKLCLQLAKGVEILHSKNILHLDIKPANVLYGFDKYWKFADLGISQIVNETKDKNSGIVGYTEGYASPEQYQDVACNVRKDLTKASDIYSLGVAFMNITGVDIHSKQLANQKFNKINYDECLNPYYEEFNKTIIKRMVQYNTEDRMSIQEVIKQLQILIGNKNEQNDSEENTRMKARKITATTTTSTLILSSPQIHATNQLQKSVRLNKQISMLTSNDNITKQQTDPETNQNKSSIFKSKSNMDKLLNHIESNKASSATLSSQDIIRKQLNDLEINKTASILSPQPSLDQQQNDQQTNKKRLKIPNIRGDMFKNNFDLNKNVSIIDLQKNGIEQNKIASTFSPKSNRHKILNDYDINKQSSVLSPKTNNELDLFRREAKHSPRASIDRQQSMIQEDHFKQDYYLANPNQRAQLKNEDNFSSMLKQIRNNEKKRIVKNLIIRTDNQISQSQAEQSLSFQAQNSEMNQNMTSLPQLKNQSQLNSQINLQKSMFASANYLECNSPISTQASDSNRRKRTTQKTFLQMNSMQYNYNYDDKQQQSASSFSNNDSPSHQKREGVSLPMISQNGSNQKISSYNESFSSNEQKQLSSYHKPLQKQSSININSPLISQKEGLSKFSKYGYSLSFNPHE